MATIYKTIHYHIYSDAGFSTENQRGVAGYLLFESEADHTESFVVKPIQINVFEEQNNIRAELRGVIFALEAAIEIRAQTDAGGGVTEAQVNLYTDCQSIARLPDRRARLESSGYVSNRTKKSLSNADLYRQFFAVYDKAHPTIIWVKGHTPKSDRNIIQTNFSHVDNAVRKALRRDIRRGGTNPGTR